MTCVIKRTILFILHGFYLGFDKVEYLLLLQIPLNSKKIQFERKTYIYKNEIQK